MNANFKNMFRALTVRNYRLFFAGQGISLIGTWIQRTTMGWFVYRLTESPFLLGLISFLSMIPSIFISPFAGTWADRWNRHKIIIGTQIAFFIQSSLLALFVVTGVIDSSRIWVLMLLSVAQGMIEGVDAPIRQSFVIDLVKVRSMVPNAIAMNSAMFNGARLIGPALGGFLIQVFGEGLCFSINAVSYIAVILMLFMMRIQYEPMVQDKESTLKKILEGWRYAWHQFPIRVLVMNLAVYTMFGMSYATILPVFVRDVLKGQSSTMGLMLSTAGIGALLGSFFLASRTTIRGIASRMLFIGAGVSATLIVFSFSKSIYINMPLMVIIGFGMMMQMASTNTLIQSVVDDKMRGRVLSIYTMAFTAVTPFGSLLVGSLSSTWGVQPALAICALVCLIWSLSGLSILGKFTRSVLRMLVRSKNQEIYRPKQVLISPKPGLINESI
ncbi:MAG: MFS transporter [Candidatus Cloacimonetes bacterium HGW-Cloacimonetes-2]|jgi:MFS family permease|nr:MAG: MFS transporter [Candidatus Cloacimonetes bacterium HGW-Cloacimonetes-2]